MRRVKAGSGRAAPDRGSTGVGPRPPQPRRTAASRRGAARRRAGGQKGSKPPAGKPSPGPGGRQRTALTSGGTGAQFARAGRGRGGVRG